MRIENKAEKKRFKKAREEEKKARKYIRAGIATERSRVYLRHSQNDSTKHERKIEALESQERNSPGSDEAKKMDEDKVEEAGASVSDPGDSNEKMSSNVESESGKV